MSNIASKTTIEDAEEAAVMMKSHCDLKGAVDWLRHRKGMSAEEHSQLHLQTPNRFIPHSH